MDSLALDVIEVILIEIKILAKIQITKVAIYMEKDPKDLYCEKLLLYLILCCSKLDCWSLKINSLLFVGKANSLQQSGAAVR